MRRRGVSRQGELLRQMVMVTLLAAAFILAGCSKVNQQNYARLKIGMDYGEVVTILGEPASCDSVLSATNCRWGRANRSIEISFVSNKAVFLSSKGL